MSTDPFADPFVDDLLTDALDGRDPQWRRKVVGGPTAQAMADVPRSVVVSLNASPRLAGLLARMAAERGMTRTALIRHLCAAAVAAAYGEDVHDLTAVRR